MKNKKTVYKSNGRRSPKKRPVAKAGLWRSNPIKKFIKKEIRRNRPLHIKILLHPLSAMVLICAGVYIALWTGQVVANRSISATVEAQPLTSGAVITYPLDNAVFNENLITVHGTCPQDSYVKLYSSNIFSGVAWCIDGVFDIQLDLFDSKNVLVAQAYNFTNNPGPVTSPVTVTYKTPPTSISSSSEQVVVVSPPLILITDFNYKTVNIGDDFNWTITLEGGQSPYVFNINWGDGTSNRQTFNTNPTYTLTHKYAGPGYYTIIAHVTDVTGTARTIQMTSLVLDSNVAGMRSGTGWDGSRPVLAASEDQNFMLEAKEWLWLAWPSFIIIALMSIAFRLGERQAYCLMLKKRRFRLKKA